MTRLKDKVAIITGAASGMGAEEAKLFAAEGASVMITDVQEEKLKEVKAAIVAAGGRAEYVVHDVTSAADWKNVAEKTAALYGKIDILVNNAGIAGFARSFMESTPEMYDKILSINLKAHFTGIQTVIPYMREQGKGSIVNISSIAGIVAAPFSHPAYSASKGGVRLLTKAAAVDFAKENIRVNSVHPGTIRTPMITSAGLSQEDEQLVNASIPMRRIAEPKEVAYAVLFLASDESSYVTGSELVVDGGYTAQ
jgi:NAD(P)-dependent dehydrogenase (short-subunit alcohol dehydrogenase family)